MLRAVFGQSLSLVLGSVALVPSGSVPARIGLIHEANLRGLYHNRPGRNQDAIMSRRRWEVRPSLCMVVLQSKARLSSYSTWHGRS